MTSRPPWLCTTGSLTCRCQRCRDDMASKVNKKSPSSRGFHLSQEITRNQRAMEQQQDIAQQPERITHISNFMLCRPVVFVNARSCFNSCRADSPGETRNTVRCASRLRSIAGHVDLEARGARLAHGEMAPRKSLRPASGRWPPRCRQSTTGTSSAAGRGSGALSAPQREPSGQDGVGQFPIRVVMVHFFNDYGKKHVALGADGAEIFSR